MLVQRRTFDEVALKFNECTCENIFFEGDSIDEILHL